MPWPDAHFDLVISINTLHNFYNYELDASLREIERVGRGAKYLCVEAYRNAREKVNLMYWQLTCRIFHTPAVVFADDGEIELGCCFHYRMLATNIFGFVLSKSQRLEKSYLFRKDEKQILQL